MYTGNFYRICLFGLLAVTNGIPLESPGLQLQEYSFNVTFEDNSVLNYASDIAHIRDDKRMTEFCRSGWWVSYDNFNYKTWYGDHYGYDIHYEYRSDHILDPSCGKPRAGFYFRSIRSARILGFEDNSPSVTFFSEKFFGGEKTIASPGTSFPVLPYEVKSYAAFNQQVKFFEKENFEGQSFCHDGAGCNTETFNNDVYSLCNDVGISGNYWDLPFIPKSATVGCK